MKRLPVAAMIAAGILVLGACSSANGDADAPAKTSSTTALSQPAQDKTVTINAAGFEPYWVIVALDHGVTFENTTATAQQIVFDNARDASGAALQSPLIAPGDTWVWKADSFASFAYHSPQLPGKDGRIQVDPPAEP